MNVDPSAIIDRLRALLTRDPETHRPQNSVVAFDADGTLWSGDVGEDVFEAAIREQLLTELAQPALLQCAEAHGVSASGDANSLAESIFRAYQAGAFPERVVCEVMTWCYAGIKVSDFSKFSQEILARRGIAERYNRQLSPILEFLRQQRVRTVVISASPELIVELGAQALGFAAQDVIAAEPLIVEGCIQPQMLRPAPYAEHKVHAYRRVFGQARWLGCFGDNIFDADMLRAAELAVAVRPKPALRRALDGVPGIIVLE